jgi:hypothetical protein
MIAGLELENYNLSHNLKTKYGSPMQRFVGAARKKTHKIKVEHGIKKKK